MTPSRLVPPQRLKSVARAVVRLATDSWKEGDHPRAGNGQFGSGGGGASGAPKSEKVTAGGTDAKIKALFSKSLGMKREDMPQIPKKFQAEFLQELDADTPVRHEVVKADTLKPTQGDYKTDTITGMVDSGVDPNRGSIVVSSDGYVLDGHHRWAASALSGQSIHAIKVGLPIRRLLYAAEQFNQRHGVERRYADEVKAAADAWVEADHPRSENGQFGPGNGAHRIARVAETDKAPAKPKANGASFGAMFHGTALPFEKFEVGSERTRMGAGENHQGQAVYLTNDPQGYGRFFANAAAQKRSFRDMSLSPEERDRLDQSAGTMMHVTVAPDAKILDMRADNVDADLVDKFKRSKRSKEDAKVFQDAILDAGYDGVAFHEPTYLEGWKTREDAATVVVYSPDKVKVEKHEPAENHDPRLNPHLATDEALVIRPRVPGLAFDKASVRSFDVDGRLRVELTNISKATVNPYLGSEIPGGEELGLDPRKIYQLLRDPDELEAAADTFNSIPVLSEHRPVSADDHQPDLVVGSTGTDAVFEAPYLKNSLVVWSSDAIKGIESGEQRELSCAYRYTPVMEPGTYEGMRYDGRMTQLIGNHVALVATGRAGPDVVVGDSQLPKDPTMKSKPLSRHATLAKGALVGLVMPRLAVDQRIDFNALLTGIDAANWKSKKTDIAKAIRPKLAKDADIADVAKLLDAFDPGNPGVEDVPPADAPNPNEMLDAVDADPCEEILAMLRGKVSDEDLAAVAAKLQSLLAPAADELPPTPPATPIDDNPADPMADKKEPPAMDAVNKLVAAAIDKQKAEARAAAEAREAVRPFVGSVAVALDSAEAIYRSALTMLNVKHEGVHASALRAVLDAQKQGTARTAIAQDAAPNGEFLTRFPGLAA